MSRNPITFSLGTVPAAVAAAYLPFVRGGSLFFGSGVPRCGISLLGAGSMRYRHTEENPSRDGFFASQGVNPRAVAPLELIHSRTVYCVSAASDTAGLQGDGILTVRGGPVPSVTVADCMPLYLFDPVSGCFGVLHSGWKGTGIILEALSLAKKEYGANPADFSVILGPHINSCCYAVDGERARNFASRFVPESVVFRSDPITGVQRPFLSLAAANIGLLVQAGVPADNISVCADCTCCSAFLGSFRRQTASLPSEMPLETRLQFFTPMAAFVFFALQDSAKLDNISINNYSMP